MIQRGRLVNKPGERALRTAIRGNETRHKQREQCTLREGEIGTEEQEVMRHANEDAGENVAAKRSPCTSVLLLPLSPNSLHAAQNGVSSQKWLHLYTAQQKPGS